MAVIMSHGDFVTKILMTSANIKGFFQLLFSNANDDLIAAAYAWDSSDEVELDEPFVQGLISAFVSAGAVTQDAVDRMDAEIEKQNPTYTEVQYDVSEIPRNVEDWIKANRIPSDIPYILNGNTCTITGELPIPARRI